MMDLKKVSPQKSKRIKEEGILANALDVANFLAHLLSIFRNGILNIIFLVLFVFAILIFLVIENDVKDYHSNAYSPLVEINLKGHLRENPIPNDYRLQVQIQLDEILYGFREYDLRNIHEGLLNLAENQRVEEIFIELTTLQDVELTSARRIRADLAYIKEKNPNVRIIAYGEYYSASALYIASIADKIVLRRSGGFKFRNMLPNSFFFKDENTPNLLSENLQGELFFLANQESSKVNILSKKELQEHYQEDEYKQKQFLWELYLDDIISKNKRFAPLKELYKDSDNYLELLKASNGSEAILLKNLGLVDEIRNRQEIYDEYIAKYGSNDDFPTKPDFYSFNDYLVNISKNKKAQTAISPEADTYRNHLAVVFAHGPMVSNRENYEDFSVDYLELQLIQAYKDPFCKAVLLYLDSQGGALQTSDKLRFRLKRLKDHGYKVYVVVHGMATSASYYLASIADKLFFTEDSITGSFNLFSLRLPKYSMRLSDEERLRYQDIDGYIANMSDKSQEFYKINVSNLLNGFINSIKSSRAQITDATLKDFNQNILYTAAEAKKLHLIDEIASLEDAINIIQDDFTHKIKPIYVTDVDNKKFGSVFAFLTKIAMQILPREQLVYIREHLVKKIPEAPASDELLEYRSKSLVQKIQF